MKRIKKRFGFFILFIVVGIIVTLTINTFSENEESYIFWFQSIMGFFSLCAILFCIWRNIKSEHAKRKLFAYTSIFLAEIILILVISYVFRINTRNTWLSIIGADVLFFTSSVLLFDLAKSIKEKHKSIAILLYLSICFLVITLVTINIFYFVVT